MKKMVALVMIVAFVFVLTTPVFADLSKPMDKAYHGVEKIVKAPMHLVNDPRDEYKAATFKPFGLFGGIMKGVSYTLIEVGQGMFDVVTSPLTFLDK